MTLDVVTAAVEEVDVSMAKDVAEDVDKEAGQDIVGHNQRGRGGGIGAYENGISISYFTCYFEYAGWAAL